jgi:hypothetical protein
VRDFNLISWHKTQRYKRARKGLRNQSETFCYLTPVTFFYPIFVSLSSVRQMSKHGRDTDWSKIIGTSPKPKKGKLNRSFERVSSILNIVVKMKTTMKN